MKKRWLSILVIVGILSSLSSVMAQSDTLSPEEQAALAAALEAGVQYNAFESYQVEAISTNESYILVEAGDISQVTEQSREVTTSGQIIRGETPNGVGQVSVTSFAQTPDSPDPINLAFDGEMRYVDEVLYVIAKFQAGSDEPFELPSEWTIVADPVADYPQLDDFQLDDFVETLMGENFNPLLETDLIEENIVAVNVESVELPTGITADHIQLVFEVEMLPTFINRDPASAGEDLNNPLLLLTKAEGSQLVFDVFLDADGNLVGIGSSYLLLIDAQPLDTPQGVPATVTVSLDIAQQSYFSNVDTELEPVVAPVE